MTVCMCMMDVGFYRFVSVDVYFAIVVVTTD
jgi:hypothetical protein